jgi:hypothetical protein
VISQLLVALGLMALTVAVHAAGLSWSLRRLRNARPPMARFWAWTRLFVLVSAWIVLLHVAEITIWAMFYRWQHAMPDLASALYFSVVTYTTTGYGDVVLPEAWRLVGGVEALTGILMCGWSTGFFFAVVNRFYTATPEPGR